MGRAVMSYFIVFAVLFSLNTAVFADEDSVMRAEQQAAEIHAKAMSDVIYTEQEIKALYFQNVAMISLLEDIKSLLQENLDELKSQNKQS